MLCPSCDNTQLAMGDRQGIEIDYCPKCRGIWLDRGELDKIVERAVTETQAAAGQRNTDLLDGYGYDGGRHDGKHGSDHRKKSFWREIFD